MFKKVLLFVFLPMVLLLIVTLTGGYFYLREIYLTTPGVEEFVARKIPQSSTIYDRTGQHELYKIYADQDRKILSHEEIPDVVRVTTLAAEDGSFFQHPGFDLSAILRAWRANLQAGDIEQGASTITQQLVRNVFLSREQTLERKIKEIVIAVKLEKTFSKDQILDFYLNEIPYGSNIYGVESAAQHFYRKSATELTLDEAAFLAALPKAPTYFSPYGSHQKKLLRRQKYILRRLVELELWDQPAVIEALKKDIRVYPVTYPIDAPHFVFHAIEELEKAYGADFIRTGGLKIYTTLDYDLHQKAQAIVTRRAQENETRFGAENASLVALDPRTGEILTMIGSRDYFDQSIDGQVNVATRPRQPGSAFKPIAYAKAFEKGYQPETVFYDVVTDFGPDGSGRNYIPRNYDNRTRGLVSMRSALAMSLNIPAVKTLYLAGVAETIELAERLGITTLVRKNIYGLSLVLGGGEVNLLELSGAYGVFANEGYRVPTSSILKITDQQDHPVAFPQKESSQTVSSEVARKINSVLSDNSARTPVFGPNSDLHLPDQVVAAKTGTTQNYRDAWTVGYASDLVVGVWAGNNDNRPMRAGAAGIFAAAPLWKEFMIEAIGNRKTQLATDYQKIESKNFMVTGRLESKPIHRHKETKKILTPEELARLSREEIEQISRRANLSILSYINKDDPLGPPLVDSNDPMLRRWNAALKKEKED